MLQLANRALYVSAINAALIKFVTEKCSNYFAKQFDLNEKLVERCD